MVILEARTKKGEQRLKRWGIRWKVKEIRDDKLLIYADGDNSGTPTSLPKSIRWIDTKDDADFEIIAEFQSSE